MKPLTAWAPNGAMRPFLRRPALSLALLLSATLSLVAEPKPLPAPEATEGWVQLFDGETLFGWAPRGSAKWSVEDGAVSYQAGSGGGYLATTSEFADFQ